MDKIAMRILIFLLALVAMGHAQTYRTVTADTNNVIRTNFTIGSAQVSGAFAISNITGLQSALDGKLATNGDGSGLTNLPNADLGSATGVLPLSNGGTGQTNAALAIEALLPAYTNNADAILALNSNATGLIWTTNGGGGGLPETPLSVTNGGTGGTNRESALGGLGVFTANGGVRLDTNSNVPNDSRHITIGYDIVATNTNYASYKAVAIGDAAFVTFGGIAIGAGADTEDGISIGRTAYAKGRAVAIGYNASAIGANLNSGSEGGVAVGWGAVSYTNGGGAVGRSAATYGGGAIGASAFTRAGGAVGWNANSSNGIAGGTNAWTRNGVALGPDSRTTNGVQLLTGTNTADNTIQFLSAGSVDTNEWAALANAGTVGTNLLRSADITNAQAAIFAATTTNAPTNTNAPTPDAWLDIRVGTNDYKLPLWQ